jgi:hypothetical protein
MEGFPVDGFFLAHASAANTKVGGAAGIDDGGW